MYYYGILSDFVFLYTFIVLFVLGADGASCPIQLDLWRSVYNITFLQAYLFIVVGGYIGTVFCFYACNDCISTHALDSDCRYCAIYCVMCISIFK